MDTLLCACRVKIYWILMFQDVKNQCLTQGVHYAWMGAPLLTQNGCWESREMAELQGACGIEHFLLTHGPVLTNKPTDPRTSSQPE